MNMLVLDCDDDLLLQNTFLFFLEPQAGARVATTTLGLGVCKCPGPKVVVDWYTNGEETRTK